MARPKIYDVNDIVEKLNTYIKEHEEPMITEFCLEYDISRQYLYELKDKELNNNNSKLADTIKKAIEKEEMFLVKNAERQKINPVFAMFRLKQPTFGYKDKQEIESNNTNTNKTTMDLSKFTVDQLKEMIKE